VKLHPSNGQIGSGVVPAATDPEIMRRLAGGDTGALGELYDRHSARVRRFLARATADAEDVDDLVHAAFLEAARSAGRYDGRASCHPWLVGIAAQLLRRRRKALGRFLGFVSLLGRSRAPAPDPQSALHARNDVERALQGISEAKRVAFLMLEVEGLTCPEIAAALSIPIGTVWTRLHAARRELRRALEAGEP
jgi:RNA polymerase sigma-70 factor (ECF subfamily)